MGGDLGVGGWCGVMGGVGGCGVVIWGGCYRLLAAAFKTV